MRYICIILGFLTGKTGVKCDECANLDAEGKCYDHKMPDDIVHKPIACGFWKHKQVRECRPGIFWGARNVVVAAVGRIFGTIV